MKVPSKALGALCAVCVAASGYVFSKRSNDNLQEVDIRLQEVAHCALKHSTVDFVVVDGGRTEAEHKNNVAAGRSWIKRSKHQDGLAIDIAALHKGKVTYNPALYYKIAEAFWYCSEGLKTPIIWGGEWRVQDLMHYELK
jgi:peptidoglycan L-alanyl-D-glutamate endopeptidase CwlK